MSTILGRLNQNPIGLRCADGSWKLLKSSDHSLEQNIAILKQLHATVPIKVDIQPIDMQLVAGYLQTRHPNLKLFNATKRAGLAIASMVMAAGISHECWSGGEAVSVQLNSSIAVHRTISEVVERTALKELCFANNTTPWATAAITRSDRAQQLASQEFLERWIICNAMSKEYGYEIRRLRGAYHRVFETVAFEWDARGGTLTSYEVVNPFNLPVVLVRVAVQAHGKDWVFFGNGIGSTIAHAQHKAGLESLTFALYRESSWQTALYSREDAVTHRIRDWQSTSLPTNGVQVDPALEDLTQDQFESVCLQAIAQISEATLLADHIPDLPGYFLGAVNVEGLPHWSDLKGVPIV